MRKTIFALDLLFCLAFSLLVWHNMFSFNLWQPLVILFALLLRVNVSIMLYRHERRAFWGVLLFILLFVLFAKRSFGLAVEKMVEIPVNLFASNEQLAHFYQMRWLSGNNGSLVKIIVLAWLLFFPALSYLMQTITKRLVSNTSGSCLDQLGGYLFRDRIFKRHFPMAAVLSIATLMGMGMCEPWLCLLVLPAFGYYIVNRYISRSPHWIEYIAVGIAMELLFCSQFMTNGTKIGLYAASALLVGCVCVWMWNKSKRLFHSLIAFALCGFIIPVLALGYNIYVGINTGKVRKYFDKYISTGILIVRSDDCYGLRDRYRILVDPVYKDCKIIDDENHLIMLTSEDESVVYDIIKGTVTDPDVMKYGVRCIKNFTENEAEYTNEEGDRIVQTIGAAPMSERIVIKDVQDRMVAYAGKASESGEYNFVKYLWGNEGKLVGLLRYPADDEEYYERMNREDVRSLDQSLGVESFPVGEENLFKLVNDSDWKDEQFTRFMFVYDSKGKIVKIYDPMTDKSIVAPAGGHIEFDVSEADDFWESCLDGGQVDLSFEVVPFDDEKQEGRLTYNGYR